MVGAPANRPPTTHSHESRHKQAAATAVLLPTLVDVAFPRWSMRPRAATAFATLGISDDEAVGSHGGSKGNGGALRGFEAGLANSGNAGCYGPRMWSKVSRKVHCLRQKAYSDQAVD